MRPTDWSRTARRLPTRAPNPAQTNQTGTITPAHLTTQPPYEDLKGPRVQNCPSRASSAHRPHCLKTSPHAGLFRNGETRLELGTPRFSGTRKGRRLRRKSLQIGGSVRDRRNAHPRGYRRLQAGLGPRRAVEVLYARQHRLVEPRRMTRVRKAPAVRAPGRHKLPHCPAKQAPSVRRRALPSSSISSARPGAAATLASRRKQAAGCDGRFGNPDAAQIDRLVSRLQ
jgi:hypothetical protein